MCRLRNPTKELHSTRAVGVLEARSKADERKTDAGGERCHHRNLVGASPQWRERTTSSRTASSLSLSNNTPPLVSNPSNPNPISNDGFHRRYLDHRVDYQHDFRRRKLRVFLLSRLRLHVYTESPTVLTPFPPCRRCRDRPAVHCRCLEGGQQCVLCPHLCRSDSR